MDETRISIELDREEALVLSNLLFRWIEQEHGRKIHTFIKDDAEIWALNTLFCLLETQVPEVFSPDYDKTLGRPMNVFGTAAAALGRIALLMGIMTQAKEAPII
jgi:hypothetical protein